MSVLKGGRVLRALVVLFEDKHVICFIVFITNKLPDEGGVVGSDLGIAVVPAGGVASGWSNALKIIETYIKIHSFYPVRILRSASNS